MAKKSNKTEQVLKLITKDEEVLETLDEKINPEIEVEIIQNKVQEHKFETKLKIEITPEIEIVKEIVQEIKTDSQKSLINLTEKLVRENANEVMARLKVCSCNICTQDVLALSLNSLQQKYVTTDAGKQHMQLTIYKKQYETDIIAALTKACVRVKGTPKHGGKV